MRVIALIAAYNEERFIAHCLEHLFSQGVEAYLIDNESTDQTIAVARSYLGRGLIGIETFPRHGQFSWVPLLRRKEQLAQTLEADWFMHVDADEAHLPPRSGVTLADAFAAIESHGFNAVNFLEYTFVATQESPDHDHPEFFKTMRWYYPFAPSFPRLLRAWKRQLAPVDLASSGGHLVRFPELRMYPESFPMRHYMFLSAQHIARKYAHKRFDPAAVSSGFHGFRAHLKADMIRLPAQAELRPYISDELLDSSNPWTKHFLAQLVPATA
jgi:hypothetical protein